MSPLKSIETQIEEVQIRLERAIANGHTKLASQEAKLLASLSKIKAANASQTKPLDFNARRKQNEVLLAVLNRKLDRINAAEAAKAELKKRSA